MPYYADHSYSPSLLKAYREFRKKYRDKGLTERKIDELWYRKRRCQVKR